MNTVKLLFAILLGTAAGVLMGLIISPFHRPRNKKKLFEKKKGFFSK